MDEEDEYSSSKFWQFYYLEDLEMSDVETETGIRESHAAKDDFINKQKSANSNKKMCTDTDTLNQ